MLHTLPDHPTITRHSMSKRTLKQNVLQLDSPELSRQRFQSPLALLASGVAVARTLIAEVSSQGSGGHVGGNLAAAVTAGVLELADGVAIEAACGEMLELYPKGYGLAAIVGFNGNRYPHWWKTHYGAGPCT